MKKFFILALFIISLVLIFLSKGTFLKEKIDESTNLYIIKSVVIHDEKGDIIFYGQRDLNKDISLILNNKGIYRGIFYNREGLLPIKNKGYYEEYEIKTPNWIYNNAGPERIVLGKNGEIYYTSDHYNSFLDISS
jgi:hypothetical protein